METPLEKQIGPVYPLARQVHDALLGAVYPLERRHIVVIATENDTPRTLLSLLEGLPRRTYRSVDEVAEALEGASPGMLSPSSPR